MPTIAQTSAVLAHARTALDEAARAAAGSNTQLSRDEQATLPDGLLKRSADAIRAEGGAGTRVYVDDLVERASSEVARLLGQVNQPSGQGASSVSRAEVQALAGLDADVATLVAAAYEFLTGRSAELDGAAPVTPPPPVTGPVGKLAISGVALDPPPPFGHAPPALRADGAIVMPKMADQPATLTVDIGSRRIVATLPTTETMSGRITNVGTAADLIEALRRAAPDLFVHVVENRNGVTAIELWDKPPPSPSSPIYLFAQMRDATGAKVNGLELRGPLTFVSGNFAVPQGTTMTLRLDDKLYTSTSGVAHTAGDLMRALRDQLVRDGHTVTLREYSRMAPWTFRVDS